MHGPSRTTSRRLAAAAVGSTTVALVVAGLAGLTGSPTQAAEHPGSASAATTGEAAGARTPGYLDARTLGARATASADAHRLDARTPAQLAFERSLGAQGMVDMDPLTGTPRELGRTDGYLSGASSRPARTVALDYVRAHLSDLGLTSADLGTLVFRTDYVDSFGVHNLAWTQSVDGTPVFGNGLKVKVTRTGRVLDIQGSPVSRLAALAARAPAARLTAGQARSAAQRNVGDTGPTASVSHATGGRAASTVWSDGSSAQRVWFLTPTGLRPGWSTYVTGSTGGFQHVVDGASGRVLFRRTTSDDDSNGDRFVSRSVAPAPAAASSTEAKQAKAKHHKGDAYVIDYYPGAAAGGTPKVVNLYQAGYLSRRAGFLNGRYTVAWSDVNDDNEVSPGEKTPIPGSTKKAQFKLTPFTSGQSAFCQKWFCSWNPAKADSWKKNRDADVTNAFYLASNFHDYLQDGPAKFTTKAGNFSTAGQDPVLLNALDGANTAAGLPDGNHIDNANMNTPPDGTSPTMQMYLWHFPGTTDAEDSFVPSSGAFDASVLYHEYTHGLSNRLVVDADGDSTLNSIEAGSMGEAWSDYYAMDYLVSHGFVKDGQGSGQVFEGYYLTGGTGIRTMALDCAVGAGSKGCTALDGTRGGYTYGDFPTVAGTPEVHASGEVWAQTLWDIRKALGHDVATSLITRAMSLSADDPSFLDMRNAIIQADLVGYDAKYAGALWKIFADRGMGYFAGATDGGDAAPAEDFHTPPAAYTPRTSITGTVTDPTTGDPVDGAVVKVAGFGDQFSATTGTSGTYTISGLYRGTYQKVVAEGPGYFQDVKKVTAGDTADFSILHDFAGSTGGAEIVDYSGPDYGPACGPEGAIDLSLGSGWGSSTGDDAGDPTNVFVPKQITIDMHRAVDISSLGVDPTATCGDGGSASTGQYQIQTSTDGTTFVPAAAGTFTAEDRNQLDTVDLTAGTGTGVRYVRFTILGNQTPDFATNCPAGNYSGCSFTDLTEVAVFGSPAA